jgi:hypothetical protein
VEVLVRRKWFGQDVGGILKRFDITKLDVARQDLFPRIVIVNINVFCPAARNAVIGEGDS